MRAREVLHQDECIGMRNTRQNRKIGPTKQTKDRAHVGRRHSPCYAHTQQYLDLAFHEVAKREGRTRHVVMLRVSFLYVCVK